MFLYLPVYNSPLSSPSASAPSERRGVSAGGWSVPGWEEAGGSRREPVVTVRQSRLGDELPVESWESHGWGELLQGEYRLLVNVVLDFIFGPDILLLFEIDKSFPIIIHFLCS